LTSSWKLKSFPERIYISSDKPLDVRRKHTQLISSMFDKLMDNIVINRYKHLLVASGLQFNFKKGYSKQICTMVLKEAILYYARNSSTVFCCFLDATKAFDDLTACIIANYFGN
jgi:hypothetical protein